MLRGGVHHLVGEKTVGTHLKRAVATAVSCGNFYCCMLYLRFQGSSIWWCREKTEFSKWDTTNTKKYRMDDKKPTELTQHSTWQVVKSNTMVGWRAYIVAWLCILICFLEVPANSDARSLGSPSWHPHCVFPFLPVNTCFRYPYRLMFACICCLSSLSGDFLLFVLLWSEYMLSFSDLLEIHGSLLSPFSFSCFFFSFFFFARFVFFPRTYLGSQGRACEFCAHGCFHTCIYYCCFTTPVAW